MAEYAGRLPLFHQDLYRLAGAEEAIGGGLVDERQLDGVTLTEWAERLPAEIDPGRLTVEFAVVGDDERQITVIAEPRDTCATWRGRCLGGEMSDECCSSSTPRRGTPVVALADDSGQPARRATLGEPPSARRGAARAHRRLLAEAGARQARSRRRDRRHRAGQLHRVAHRAGDRQDDRLFAGRPARRRLDDRRDRQRCARGRRTHCDGGRGDAARRRGRSVRTPCATCRRPRPTEPIRPSSSPTPAPTRMG